METASTTIPSRRCAGFLFPDLADEFFELARRRHGDLPVMVGEGDGECVAQRCVDGAGEGGFLFGSERLLDGEMRFEMIGGFLHELVLLHGRDVAVLVEAHQRPALLPVDDGHVAFAAFDGAQRGQGAPAGARACNFRVIADGVAQQRHGVVGQVGDHHAADFALGAGLAIIVEHLHDQMLIGDVVEAAFGALHGDGAQFLRAVGIGDGRAPLCFGAGAQGGR